MKCRAVLRPKAGSDQVSAPLDALCRRTPLPCVCHYPQQSDVTAFHPTPLTALLITSFYSLRDFAYPESSSALVATVGPSAERIVCNAVLGKFLRLAGLRLGFFAADHYAQNFAR